MNHHTLESFCPLCEEKLVECALELRELFHVIKSHFPDCHISCGWRNKVDQNKAFELKKTNAPWPKSEHNKMEQGKPCSRAMDLFRLTDLGSAEFVRAYYLEIAQYLNRLRMDVNWSGDWANFVESNHFELRKV